MGQMIWVSIKGQKQGDIKSDVNRKGFEGKIDVLNYTDSVSVPYDGTSGLPSGRREHSTISFAKVIDKTSPLLASAAFTNENLPTVKFEFLRPSPTLGASAGEKVFFTIELANARIVSLTRTVTGDARTESIELTFEKITITYLDGGVTADDDWSAGYNNQI